MFLPNPALTRIVSFHKVWSGKKLVGIFLWMVAGQCTWRSGFSILAFMFGESVMVLHCLYPMFYYKLSNQARQTWLIAEKNDNWRSGATGGNLKIDWYSHFVPDRPSAMPNLWTEYSKEFCENWSSGSKCQCTRKVRLSQVPPLLHGWYWWQPAKKGNWDQKRWESGQSSLA